MTVVKLQIDREPPARQNWNIDSIVSALRDIRHESPTARNRLGKPAKLPSRAALAAIVEGLSAALFPNRLSSQRLTHENVDYFVGHTLDIRLRELMDQIVRELHFNYFNCAPS
jgi:serine O-acetyltransferase